MFCKARLFALFICCTTTMVVGSCRDAFAQGFTQTVAGSSLANASSFVGGVHGGYNWVQGTFLFGLETDIQGMNLNSPMFAGLVYIPPPGPPGVPDLASAHAQVQWYGTLRGRLGATFGPLLVFVTGGLAYGDVELRSAFSAFGLSTLAQAQETKVGGVVGLGLEYLVTPNLMLTFNYQYVDLGKMNIASSTAGLTICCGAATLSQAANVNAQFQTAMIGFSWRFAPGNSPSPFAGGYVGGHLGGAWGNSANALYNGSATQNIILD